MKPPPRLTESLELLQKGGVPAEGLLAEAERRLDRLGPRDRTVCHRYRARGDADRAWWGVAYLTKANLAVLGEPLDCGSAILSGFRAPYEATAIARLRAAGATCLGATNMDEFAMGSSGETSVHGPVEHPFLAGCVCGGSSSGSAAAVARRLVPFALGSDTGGSVRQPAAYCGLVGLKPTRGRVSRHGLVAHASSMDTVGVLATTARDARLVLEIIEGPDGLDSTLRSDLPGLRARPVRVVGAIRPEPAHADADVVANFDATVAALHADGVQVTEVELPSLDVALGAYMVLAAAESASNLARYDGSLYGAREEAPGFFDSVRRTRTRGFGSEVKLRILLGTEVLRKDHTDNALPRARQVVDRLGREVDEALRGRDALLLPTVPDVAFELGSRLGDPIAMRAADRYTVLASLLGLPAVAVPTGQDDRGAPLSVQCVAAAGEDGRALALASRIEDLAGVRVLQDEFWWPRTGELAR